MVESTSKLRDLVKGFTGFDIMEDEDTFKSIYDIILGIGEKWQDLNDIDRAALLEALAGKRAGNALAAALNNVDDLKAAYETALNASGSAMKEQENYEKSIQFSIDRLKATAQDLANDFLSSNTVKGAVDFLNTVLELLDKIVEKTGSLTPLIATIGGAFGAAKIGKGMGGVADLLGELIGSKGGDKGSILSDGLINFLEKPAFSKAAREVGEEAGEQITKNVISSISKSQAGEMISEALLASAQDGIDAATYASMQFGTSLKELQAIEAGAIAGTEGLGTAAAGATLSMGALLAIVAAIGVAIYAGVKAWDYYSTTVKEVEEQIKQTKDKIDELQSEIDNLNSIDNRNEYENSKLATLKEELAIQKDLLEIEEKRRIAEKYGEKFEDAFDEDNENVKIRKLLTGQDASGLSLFGNKVSTYIANLISKESKAFYENSIGIYDNIPNEIIKNVFDGLNKNLGSVETTLRNFENKKIANNNINNLLADKYSKLEVEKSKDNPNERRIQGLTEEIHELEKNQSNLRQEYELALLDVQQLFDQSVIEAEQIKQEKGTDSKQYKVYSSLIDKLNTYLVNEKKENGTYNFFESYDFSKAIKNDEEALRELINSEEDDLDIKSELNNKYPGLIALMDKEGITIDELIQKYKELSEESTEALDSKLSKAGMIDAITDLSDGFDKLDEVYADVYDKGAFDFTKLSTKKFEEAFKGLEDEYTEFIETVSAHPDDLNASQDAFNKLAGAYIEHSKVLDGLSEDTKELTINMLENMGIANAAEVVEANLAKMEAEEAAEKEFLAATGRQLADATAQEIQQLMNEGAVSEQTGQRMAEFALKKIAVNNATIDTSADCQNIIDLAKIAVYGTEVLERLEALKIRLADPFVGKEMKSNINTAIKNILSEAKSEAEGVDFKLPEYEYKGADKTKSAIDKANKSGEESKEIFDWIEKALQRQEEEINRIDKVVNATYKNWSKRNSSLLSEITEINKEIAMQRTAYEAYMRDAEAIPLSEEYKKLVREGAMKSEIISDKTLKKNIKEYEELYDKAIKAKDAIADLESKIAALAKAKFDNVKSEFEGFTSEIEHFVNMIDKELSHVENMEKIAGKSFYTAKMDQDEQRLEELNKERTALLQALREAEANGIEEGSADWIAMRNDIYSIDEAIADLTYEVEDLKKKLKEVAKLNFDDLKLQFENAISIITGQIDLTDSVVSMTQNAGYIASREYYKALIEGSKENVTGLRKEYETLSSTLADAMKAGDIDKYSEEWYQMSSDINNVKKELVDAANATIEYANALRQIDWDVFDRGLDRISKLVDESEFLQELMSWDDKLKDLDTGEWTAKGITKQGLMVQDYQSYMSQANAYGGEAEEIRKLLETDPKNTILIDRYHELLEAQRQAILNALKEKKALTDLIKEGYDELLKRIKKLIDEYKEALDQAKD